jgi:hypothetical protein
MAARKNAAENDPAEKLTFVAVGFVLISVPCLVFFFSFGNVGLLGTSLGVDHWIAFLTGPAVDLSVAGCVLAASYLSARGWTERQLWPLHAAASVCGLVMVALNAGQAVYEHHWRLACFDTVGPALLIGWCAIGPWLLRQLAEARRTPFAGATGVATAATSVATRPATGRTTVARPDASPSRVVDAAPAPATVAVVAEAKPATVATVEPGDATEPSQFRPQKEIDDVILDLITQRGRENVTGPAAGEALGMHRASGARHLTRVLKGLDAGTLKLPGLRETPTAAEDPDRELVLA